MPYVAPTAADEEPIVGAIANYVIDLLTKLLGEPPEHKSAALGGRHRRGSRCSAVSPLAHVLHGPRPPRLGRWSTAPTRTT